MRCVCPARASGMMPNYSRGLAVGKPMATDGCKPALPLTTKSNT